jgi:hypothetical protein
MKVIIAICAVAVCIAGTYVVWDQTSQHDDKTVVECSVTKMNEFGAAVLSADILTMDSLKAPIGSDLFIEFNGSTYTGIFVENYNGVPTSSLFVNFNSYDKEYTLGVFNGTFYGEHSIAVGDKVKLSVAGMNEYYPRITNYLKGYSDDSVDYSSDQEFANYRILSGGDMKEGKVYRCSTPWGLNGRGDAGDAFLKEVGVERLIGMDKSKEGLEEIVATKGELYSSQLFLNDKVDARFLSPAIHSHPEEIRWVIDCILDSDGSIGIFCKLGRDRTGIYCLVLQALAGATLEEVVNEYMISYTNFYGIKKGTDEYDAVYDMTLMRQLYLFQHPEMIDHMLDIDWSKVELKDFDLQKVITDFLTDYVDIPEEKIDALKAWLTE